MFRINEYCVILRGSVTLGKVFFRVCSIQKVSLKLITIFLRLPFKGLKTTRGPDTDFGMRLCQKQFHRVQRLPYFCQQRFEDEKLWFSLNLAASAISIQRAPSDDNKGLVKLLLYRPAK